MSKELRKAQQGKMSIRYLTLMGDARAKLMKAGYEPPEFFGFMFAAPDASKRKLPLLCDKDWFHLLNPYDPTPSQPSSSQLNPSEPSPSQPILTDHTRGNFSKSKKRVEPSLDDIDVGLGGLQSYDLRGLSQPIAIDAYDDANVGDVDEDDASTKRCDEYGASDLEDVNNPAVEDEIPRQLDTGNVDDDGNPYFNL
ncbi:hypothetical protein Cgig2_032894 [Carnegiea gigantea]|uniref:Uncharacterized protein n=1 Tax=Carnegiea gigantea TaxID=171969 RepID=A0A9Q1Q891_9CARY|nr:hypothetical protein Cgig2_032894 [Carnegiea gigantea]